MIVRRKAHQPRAGLDHPLAQRVEQSASRLGWRCQRPVDIGETASDRWELKPHGIYREPTRNRSDDEIG